MSRLEVRARLFACILAALAGFVDAIGFIRSGGFFVSFMSGNSTRLGVATARQTHEALLACGVIGAFVAGVILGSLVGEAAPRRRPSIVLACVAFMLGIGAYLDSVGRMLPALGALALAMGAVNTVFERGGQTRFGITYMTGGLVRVGSGIASALLGRGGNDWLSYLLLWLAFVCGTIAGAIAYGPPPNLTLSAAAVVALLLAVAALRMDSFVGAS